MSLQFADIELDDSLHEGVFLWKIIHNIMIVKQDAQLSQRDRAAGCVIVFAESRRLELGDNILQTL